VLHDLQQGKENQRQNLLETDEHRRPTNATNKQEPGETTTVAARPGAAQILAESTNKNRRW
jgi:hypothetical protein